MLAAMQFVVHTGHTVLGKDDAALCVVIYALQPSGVPPSRQSRLLQQAAAGMSASAMQASTQS
jgi:hypothetical protein